MDINVLRSLYTLLALVTFVVIAFWAWSARNRRPFDEAARLPLADDPPATGPLAAGKHES